MERPEEIEFLWLLLTGTSVTFLLGLAVVLFVIYYQRRLFGQRMQVEQMKHDQRKKLLEASIIAQEKERERMARDLHDEVGATLSTAKLYVSHILGGGSKEKATDTRQKAEALLDQAIISVRSISHNLLPVNLEEFGLISALEEIANKINETSELEVHIDHRLQGRLPSEMELHLYRIVQELLNNTLKHAGATSVIISLYHENGLLTLIYRDNGKGLNGGGSGSGPAKSGLGMKNHCDPGGNA